MSRYIVHFAALLALSAAARRADAQAPTIDTGPASPGGQNSTLGSSPGANDSLLGASLGAGPGGQAPGGLLGGRPGASTSRAPASISTPGTQGISAPPTQGLAAPPQLPLPTVPIYGSLSLPGGPEDDGPPGGLTLDQAIDRLVRENLDLRAKAFEIPQAQADILTASLRANPVFYADAQLVPYGAFTAQKPGGQTQYDINISYPLDLSRKRQARIVSATRAKKVLEAQYQDAVRVQIGNLYQSYVDVLAARQTVRYSEKSVEGLGQVLQSIQQIKQQGDNKTEADVNKVRIQVQVAEIGLFDAREQLKRAKRTLGVLLNLSPDEAEAIEVRGAVRDDGPPPPPDAELVQAALASRPDLNAYRLGIKRAEADVVLAQRNRYQDVYILAQPYTFQDNSPNGLKSPTSYALGVTVPLPIYNRNQGNIQRAKLNVTQTRIELATIERQIITDVRQAENEYIVSRTAVQRIETQLLPAAQQVLAATYQLYRNGELNIVDYLSARSDYNDAVKQFLDTAVRHRRSMLDLNTTLGQRVLP